MMYINIDNKKCFISDIYDRSRSTWVESLDNDTKLLVLDYTILWNMVEHQVYNDRFNTNEKTNKCIKKIIEREENDIHISYIWELYIEYISKYESIYEMYRSFNFGVSGISYEMIEKLYKSTENSDKLKLLIVSCYRVRCNLFHGPKCICYLDNQKLLFLVMNELLSLISKCYGM